MAPRGNKGYFHGEPLSFLNDSLPHYLSIAPIKKEIFWSKFFPEWDTKYPKLDSEELKEELEEEERLHKEETERVKVANQEEAKRRGRRKAVLQAYPATGARLNELRARAADQTKLKGWFSNAKTKEKTRKIEPFRAWLASLTALRGAPRHMQMPWVLWKDPTHGEVLRARYRTEFGKDADDEEDDVNELDGFEKEDGDDVEEDTPTRAQTLNCKRRLALTYFDELGEEEQARMQAEREKDFTGRRDAYERTLNGETECSAEELAERRRHAEVVSQRALQTLCAQMKCKGILVLGEIVDGEGDEVFISMVQEGALPGHPEVDFPTWTPLRSKALLQAFADFLVACKKEEMGRLGRLVDPAGEPATTAGAPALCAQCMSALIPLQRPAADPAPKVAEDRLPEGRAQRGERRKRGRKEAGEKEAEDSGAEEEEEDEWSGGGSDAERDDDPFANNEDEDRDDQRATPPPPPSLRYPPNTPLQRTLDAMDTPQRNYRIRDLNTLSEYEFDREKNIAKNRELLRALIPQDAGTALGLPKPRRILKPSRSTSAASASAEPRRSSRRLACLDSPAPVDVNVQTASASAAGETAHDASTDTCAVEMASGEMGGDACANEHAAINTSTFSPPLDVGARPAPPSLPAVAPATGLSGSSPAPLPSASLGSEKHNVVLELFRSEGKHPAWIAVVDAWWALEHATGFCEKSLPTLPARGRPDAVSWWVQRARKDRRIPAGLDTDDDSKEDFYDKVVSWWTYVNPAWRKEGLGSVADFEENTLKKEGGSSFEGLVSGLNGLTSVVACLWWWYRLAGVADGTPRWTKLVEDVTWVLSEKLKACRRKRGATPSEDEPPSQRVRLE